jgi:hypothetical protein
MSNRLIIGGLIGLIFEGLLDAQRVISLASMCKR